MRSRAKRWWSVAAAIGAAAIVLATTGASLFRALLSTSGTLYGAAVYHLARAHVRALRDEQPLHDAAPRQQAA